MMWQLDNFIQDIDYLANQLMMERGILPGQFYDDNSLSDIQLVMAAKSRKDRVQDPLAFARGLS